MLPPTSHGQRAAKALQASQECALELHHPAPVLHPSLIELAVFGKMARLARESRVVCWPEQLTRTAASLRLLASAPATPPTFALKGHRLSRRQSVAVQTKPCLRLPGPKVSHKSCDGREKIRGLGLPTVPASLGKTWPGQGPRLKPCRLPAAAPKTTEKTGPGKFQGKLMKSPKGVAKPAPPLRAKTWRRCVGMRRKFDAFSEVWAFWGKLHAGSPSCTRKCQRNFPRICFQS